MGEARPVSRASIGRSRLCKAPAQGDTSGKLTLESKSVAVGVGVSWGDGVLE